MRKRIQRTLLVLLLCAAHIQANCFNIQDSQQQCNATGKSKIYDDWVKRWKGSYETDRYYHQDGTPYAIKDMLEHGDIQGLTLILCDIGKREFVAHQASGGVVFLIVAIESAHTQSVEFLLQHKLTQRDNQTLYKEYAIQEKDFNGNTPEQLATKKLQEFKSKGDLKAVENYQKIIEILQKYKSQSF